MAVSEPTIKKTAEDFKQDEAENKDSDILFGQPSKSWKKNLSKKEIAQEKIEAKQIKSKQKMREKDLPQKADAILKTMLGDDVFRREEKPISFAAEPEAQDNKAIMLEEEKRLAGFQPEAPVLKASIKPAGEDFKGESPLFKEQAARFGGVRMAANMDMDELRAVDSRRPLGADINKKISGIEKPGTKEVLKDKLDQAYKDFYDLRNSDKTVPPEMYELLHKTAEELRGVVKHQGEVGDFVEKLKAKYKKDVGREKPSETKTDSNEAKQTVRLGLKIEKPNKTEDGVAIGEKNEKINQASEVSKRNNREEINKILEETMDPASRPYKTEDGFVVEEPEKKEEKKPAEKSSQPEKLAAETEKINEEKLKEKKEAAEKALAAARLEYVAAEEKRNKTKKEENKLTGIREKIREFIIGGFSDYSVDKTRVPERQGKISGAMAEAAEAEIKFLEAQAKLKEAIRSCRDGELSQLDKKAAGLKAAGSSEEQIKAELEKEAREILLATTLREAAKIESLKADRQIEQMANPRKWLNQKAEQFTGWYKELPWQTKLAVSTGLMGAGIAGGLVGSAAIITAAFVGQGALRVLGGSMATAGAEQWIKISQEKQTEKKINKEFGGKFLETLIGDNGKLDNKLFELIKAKEGEKNRRFVLAGTLGALVGTGAMGLAVKNVFNWASESTAGQAVKDKIINAWDRLAGGNSPEALKSGAAPLGKVAAVEEIKNLKIGSRGPEGAIIDNFKAKPELAKAFGWDGKTDIGKWAGTRAHQLWLESVEDELARPGMAEKLTAQGFTADAEGYAKAMHKIGQGFVALDPKGSMRLSDDTTFLKAGASDLLDAKNIPSIPEVSGNLTEADRLAESGVPVTGAEPSPHDILDNLPAGSETPPTDNIVPEVKAEPPAIKPGSVLSGQASGGPIEFSQPAGPIKSADILNSALTPDKHVLLDNLIDSKATPEDLVRQISSGKITSEDFIQYQAEHFKGKNLPEVDIQNLRKNMDILNGSIGSSKSNERPLAKRAIYLILERLRQNK